MYVCMYIFSKVKPLLTVPMRICTTPPYLPDIIFSLLAPPSFCFYSTGLPCVLLEYLNMLLPQSRCTGCSFHLEPLPFFHGLSSPQDFPPCPPLPVSEQFPTSSLLFSLSSHPQHTVLLTLLLSPPLQCQSHEAQT